MSNISGVNGSSGVYAAGGIGGFTGLSPDALLEYCQSQLNGLDGEIQSSIKQQNLELQERQAAEQAQGVLEQFGDNGPTNGAQMQSCVDALNTAIASLPTGDPVAAQLADFRDKMCTDYGFTPGTTLTTPADVQGGVGPSGSAAAATTLAAPPVFEDGSVTDYSDGTTTQGGATPSPAAGTSGGSATSPAPVKDEMPPSELTKPPENNQWKGTCDALGNIVGDIKSNSEIQMLQLQDLVSQRQQAVSLATGMMSKEDQSLEQLARLGQG